jgi:hypothetical protein
LLGRDASYRYKKWLEITNFEEKEIEKLKEEQETLQLPT